eukprot:4563625-Prymnesium_polylepis.1
MEDRTIFSLLYVDMCPVGDCFVSIRGPRVRFAYPCASPPQCAVAAAVVLPLFSFASTGVVLIPRRPTASARAHRACGSDPRA